MEYKKNDLLIIFKDPQIGQQIIHDVINYGIVKDALDCFYYETKIGKDKTLRCFLTMDNVIFIGYARAWYK